MKSNALFNRPVCCERLLEITILKVYYKLCSSFETMHVMITQLDHCGLQETSAVCSNWISQKNLKELGTKKTSIFQQLLNNKHRRPQAAKIIGHHIKGEMQQICSDKRATILRDTSDAAMKNFSWESVWLELQHSTPFLMAIVEHSFPAKARNERMKLLLCNATEVATAQNVLCRKQFPYCSKLDTVASR